MVGAESTTQAECDARGGKKVALYNLWMMHAWVADAWPSSWGIFSAENPDLGRKIGDINATTPRRASSLPAHPSRTDIPTGASPFVAR